MQWELKHVEDVEAVLDDFGVYVVVHRVERTETHKEYSGIRVQVRADLMKSKGDWEIISFIGTANAVRKHLIRFLREGFASGLIPNPISTEHASYIGYELLRAELTPDYVQD